MAATIKLYVDQFNQKLRAGPSTSRETSFPNLYQGEVRPFQVTIIEPRANGNPNDFAVVEPDALSLKMSILDAQPDGGGGHNAIATEFNFTADADGNFFTGELAVNTSEVDTFIGSNNTKTAWVELELTEGSNVWKIYQSSFTLVAGGITAVSGSVAAGLTPLSLEDALQRFVSFQCQNGQQIILKSPDGTKFRRIGIRDDGSLTG